MAPQIEPYSYAFTRTQTHINPLTTRDRRMHPPMDEMLHRQEDPTHHQHPRKQPHQHFPDEQSHQHFPDEQPHQHFPDEQPHQHFPHEQPHQHFPHEQPHRHFPHEQPHRHFRDKNRMDHKPMIMPSRFRPNPPKRQHCICLTIFFLLLGIIILILWLAYHPSKPRFSVASATIFGLNATTPLLMTISMQFTIIIKNPNRRVSIYFDRLSAFVSYRNQPITPHIMLPPLYLGKRSAVSLTPEMGGTPVPVSVEVSNGLEVDETYGVVPMKLVFLGRLRWRAGDINSAHYGLYVKCDLLLGLKKGFVGQIPLLGAPVCEVDT